MKYVITNWDGDKYFILKMVWKGYEVEIHETYFQELRLNIEHQINEICN